MNSKERLISVFRRKKQKTRSNTMGTSNRWLFFKFFKRKKYRDEFD